MFPEGSLFCFLCSGEHVGLWLSSQALPCFLGLVLALRLTLSGDTVSWGGGGLQVQKQVAWELTGL